MVAATAAAPVRLRPPKSAPSPPHPPSPATPPASPRLASVTPHDEARSSRRRSSPPRRPLPTGTTLLRLTFAGGARGAAPAVALFSPPPSPLSSAEGAAAAAGEAPPPPTRFPRRTRVAVRVVSRVAGFSGAVTTTAGGVTTTVVELPAPPPPSAAGATATTATTDALAGVAAVDAATLAAVAAPAAADIVTAGPLRDVDIALDVYTAAAGAAAGGAAAAADWTHVGTASLDGGAAATAAATRVLVLPLRAREGRRRGGVAAARVGSLTVEALTCTALPAGVAAALATAPPRLGGGVTAGAGGPDVGVPVPVDDGRYGGGGGAVVGAPSWGPPPLVAFPDRSSVPLGGRLEEDLTDEEEGLAARPPPSHRCRHATGGGGDPTAPPTLADLLEATASPLTTPATSVVSSTPAAAAAAAAGVPPPAVVGAAAAAETEEGGGAPPPAVAVAAMAVAAAVAHSASAPDLLGRPAVGGGGGPPAGPHHPYAAYPGGIRAPLPTLADVTGGLPPTTTLYVELKVPPPALERRLPVAAADRNALLDATLAVLAAAPHRVVLLSFDAPAAVLAGLKQTAYPVYLLNAERREELVDAADERTVTVGAAAAAAAAAGLDGLVLRSDLLLDDGPAGADRVATVAAAGLALLTYGRENGGVEGVLAQRALGVGGCICDGAAAVARGVAAADAAAGGGRAQAARLTGRAAAASVPL
ncbi:hypothetical protein I4F81_004002 [Pyropia yezoensis]|uniref:Uncharacterized protein n=1 Tax=Pyropia yezoensis TaxID=2788 RepID=A0ACC3BUZ1_PYRYE|nr:hypothetical protein I4F81_004002 [Neopyropia yezoensis]